MKIKCEKCGGEFNNKMFKLHVRNTHLDEFNNNEEMELFVIKYRFNLSDDLVSEMISNVKRQMAIENKNVSYIEFNIICIDKYSSTPLYELMNSKPYNENVELRMIVGTDRFSFFDSFYSAFLLNNTPVNKIRIKFLKRSDDGSGVESMSATKIRNQK